MCVGMDWVGFGSVVVKGVGVWCDGLWWIGACMCVWIGSIRFDSIDNGGHREGVAWCYWIAHRS
jgi:hypothetical protein